MSTGLAELAGEHQAVLANTIATHRCVDVLRNHPVAIIWYLHETELGREYMQHNPGLAQTIAKASVLVTPTRATADIYRPFTQAPIHVIRHGFSDLTSHRQSRTGPIRFVILASYERRKGQDVFLEAIRLLEHDLQSRALFEMAGAILETEFHDQLLRSSKSLPNVRLLTSFDHSNSIQFLDRSDVVVCASRDESFPITLVEAMALGKAIVSTKVGGISEILRDGIDALLVPSESPGALANAFGRLLFNPRLVLALGSEARRSFHENFNLEKYGRAFAGLIADTMRKADPESC
jgi:glycosyltransferase involved in cell wall biosynthesis